MLKLTVLYLLLVLLADSNAEASGLADELPGLRGAQVWNRTDIDPSIIGKRRWMKENLDDPLSRRASKKYSS